MEESKIIIPYLKKIYIKFLNWRAGNGFTIPDPGPFECCMYKYCKSILENKNINKIQGYENKIAKSIEKFPEATRKDVAEQYIKALEWVFGKEKF